MMQAKKRKKKKSPPFISEILLGIGDFRFGSRWSSRRLRVAKGIVAVRQELLTHEGLESTNLPPIDWDDVDTNLETLQERVPFRTDDGREFVVVFRMGKRSDEHGLEDLPVTEIGLEDAEGRMMVTGGGDAVEVLRKTLAISRQYLKRNTDLPYVVFSSLEDERGRRRIYRKIAEAFSPDGTYLEEQDGPFRTFVIRNPFAEADEIGRPWHENGDGNGSAPS